MSEMINQCCYTHLDSWKAVAQKGMFEQKYIAELARHSTLPGPEFGENLSVYETVGYGDKFLVMRTQYGLKDLSTESLRSSMFSHGYLIDTARDPFDPNVFLTIGDENFCTDEEAANAPRDSFLRSNKYTLQSAMQEAGLTKASYCKLIKCVYQLSVRSVNKRSLFIKVKDAKQSKAILYCIYAGMMPRYAKLLSSASANYNFADSRNVVFVSEVNSSKKFFIPETGENNTLSENVEKNLDLLYFVDYGVRTFDDAEIIQEYYQELENTLSQIAGSRQVDDDVLKLAHVMTADPQPSKNCDIVSDDTALMDVLRLAAEFNAEAENEQVKDYIEKLRAEAISRGLIKIAPKEPEVREPEQANHQNLLNGNGNSSAGGQFGNRRQAPPISSNNNWTGQTDGQFDNRRQTPPMSGMATRSPADFSIRTDVYSGNPPVSPSQSHDTYDVFGSVPAGQTWASDGNDRPLSSSDKQRFEKGIGKIAKGGPGNLAEFASFISDYVNNSRVNRDVQSRNDYVESILKGLQKMTAQGMEKIDEPGYSQNPLELFRDWCRRLNVSQSQTEKHILDFCLYYWNVFEWEKFTPDRASDYQYFRIDETMQRKYPTLDRKSIMVSYFANCLAFLLNNSWNYRVEDWLLELNRSYAQYKLQLNSGEGMSAFIEYISECFTDDMPFVMPLDAFYYAERVRYHVVRIVASLPENDFKRCMNTWRHLFNLLDSAKRMNRDVVYGEKDLEVIDSFAREAFYSPEVKAFVLKETTHFLFALDETVCMVPFDFWLALRREGEESPFRIFYEGEEIPRVVDTPAADIVKNSMLLKDEFFMNILWNDEKNNKSKIIKSLIREIKPDDNTSFGSKMKGFFKKK